MVTDQPANYENDNITRVVKSVHCEQINQMCFGAVPVLFTFMHLADTFIQSDLQCIQAIHFFLSVFYR